MRWLNELGEQQRQRELREQQRQGEWQPSCQSWRPVGDAGRGRRRPSQTCCAELSRLPPIVCVCTPLMPRERRTWNRLFRKFGVLHPLPLTPSE